MTFLDTTEGVGVRAKYTRMEGKRWETVHILVCYPVCTTRTRTVVRVARNQNVQPREALKRNFGHYIVILLLLFNLCMCTCSMFVLCAVYTCIRFHFTSIIRFLLPVPLPTYLPFYLT